MSLTADETRELESYLNKELRRWKGWRLLRLFCLFMGIVWCCLAVMTWLVIFQMNPSSPFPSTTDPRLATQPAIVNGLEILQLRAELMYIDIRHTAFISGGVMFVIGIWLLDFTFSNWNRHRKSFLLVKLIRSQMPNQNESNHDVPTNL